MPRKRAKRNTPKRETPSIPLQEFNFPVEGVTIMAKDKQEAIAKLAEINSN